MSLSGNIETMPLPDILQFIGLGRKTGVLTVKHVRRRKHVCFHEGLAVFCSSNCPKEYLGQHLLVRTNRVEGARSQAHQRFILGDDG